MVIVSRVTLAPVQRTGEGHEPVQRFSQKDQFGDQHSVFEMMVIVQKWPTWKK